jgi:hypothetical protein
MAIDLTTQLIPLFWYMVALLVVASAAIAAFVERDPDTHRSDALLPERLFASEAVALATGVALFVVAATTLRW